MSVLKSVRLAVAGALVLAMPVQAVTAAVRPSAAIPTAATAVAAQDEEGTRGAGLAWPAIGVIIAAIVAAVLIERRSGNGRGTGFSR